MSTHKPFQRTVLFENPKLPGTDKVVAAVTFYADKGAVGSNYFQLLDSEGKEVARITWPDHLKPRVI